MKDEIPAVPPATELNIPSLNQKVCLMLGERQLFVSLPFDGVNTRKPDWGVIIEFAKEHPAARLLLWLGGKVTEL